MIEPILNRYRKRLTVLSAKTLLLELTVLSFVLKFIPGLLMGLFVSEPFQTTTEVQLEHQSELYVVFMAVIVAPPLETIIGQWIPILIVSFFTRKLYYQLTIPAVLFGLMHIYAGWASVLIILFPGLVFTLCFISQQERSLWQAYWTTTVLHAVHNLISLLVYFIVF